MNTRGKSKGNREKVTPTKPDQKKHKERVVETEESDNQLIAESSTEKASNHIHVSVKGGEEPSEDWLTQLSNSPSCQSSGNEKKVITVNLVVNLPENQLFRCGLCEIVLPSISLLHKHILVHDGCTSFEFFFDTYTAYPRYETGEELSKKKTVAYGKAAKMNLNKLSEMKTTRYQSKKRKNKNETTNDSKKSKFLKESDVNEPLDDNEEGNDAGAVSLLEEVDSMVGMTDAEQRTYTEMDNFIDGDKPAETTESQTTIDVDYHSETAGDMHNTEAETTGKEMAAQKTKEKQFDQTEPEDHEEEKCESQTTDHSESGVDQASNKESKAIDKERPSRPRGSVRVKAIIKEDGIETDEDGDDDNSDDDFMIEYSLDGSDSEAKKAKKRNRIDPNVQVKCETCGKVVKYSQLKDHRAWAHDVQDCECEKCGKHFGNKYKLRMHMRTHTFNFKCELCPKQYSRKEDLNRHMDWHKGVKRHVCPECNMKFAAKSALRKHTANIHKGLRPFVCHICGKSFAGLSSLQVHNSTHYEPTLPCRFCDRSFRVPQQLEKHENKHLDNKLYECHICDHKWSGSAEYYSHMVRMHKLDRDNIKNAMKLVYEFYHRKFNKKPDLCRIPENFEEMLAELKALKSVPPSPASGVDVQDTPTDIPVDIPALRLGKDDMSESETLFTPKRKTVSKNTAVITPKALITPKRVPVSEVIKIEPVINDGKSVEGGEVVRPGTVESEVVLDAEDCQYILDESGQNQTVVLATDESGMETQTIVLSGVEEGLGEGEEQVVMLPPNINPSDIDNIMVYNDKGQLIKLVKWHTPDGEEGEGGTSAVIM